MIQRKLHDAGAFVFANRMLGNQHFLKYISSAIKMALDVMEHRKIFKEINYILKRLLEKNRDKNCGI